MICTRRGTESFALKFQSIILQTLKHIKKLSLVFNEINRKVASCDTTFIRCKHYGPLFYSKMVSLILRKPTGMSIVNLHSIFGTEGRHN